MRVRREIGETNNHSTGVSAIPRLISTVVDDASRPEHKRQAKSTNQALVKNGMVNSARAAPLAVAR